MIYLYKVLKVIRHAWFWEKADFLWDFLRKVYYFWMRLYGRGVKIQLGADLFVRLPLEAVGMDFENYETIPMSASINWLKTHSCAVLFDIGCNKGIYCVSALFASPDIEVFAFDSFLYNLVLTENMCRYAPRRKPHLIHGLITDKHKRQADALAAQLQTEQRLTAEGIDVNFKLNKYVNISDKKIDPTIPIYSIDGLFPHPNFSGRSVIIKCDVEGAELLVLRGAQRFLDQLSPVLLLSIHEYFYREHFDYSLADVRNFLDTEGYSVKPISCDREAHWWCEKDNRV